MFNTSNGRIRPRVNYLYPLNKASRTWACDKRSVCCKVSCFLATRSVLDESSCARSVWGEMNGPAEKSVEACKKMLMHDLHDAMIVHSRQQRGGRSELDWSYHWNCSAAIQSNRRNFTRLNELLVWAASILVLKDKIRPRDSRETLQLSNKTHCPSDGYVISCYEVANSKSGGEMVSIHQFVINYVWRKDENAFQHGRITNYS